MRGAGIVILIIGIVIFIFGIIPYQTVSEQVVEGVSGEQQANKAFWYAILGICLFIIGGLLAIFGKDNIEK
jgi:uncharacterized membrane protein